MLSLEIRLNSLSKHVLNKSCKNQAFCHKLYLCFTQTSTRNTYAHCFLETHVDWATWTVPAYRPLKSRLLMGHSEDMIWNMLLTSTWINSTSPTKPGRETKFRFCKGQRMGMTTDSQEAPRLSAQGFKTKHFQDTPTITDCFHKRKHFIFLLNNVITGHYFAQTAVVGKIYILKALHLSLRS